ncbi:MAG: SpoIIE family protein phosphatase [Desulfobacterales bacterium]|nr:SpoIIE family protein phosphatase [Desulfobacterales bacterium]
MFSSLKTSLKTKIIFFIFILMAVTASAILYFTHKDVGDAVLQKEIISAQNTLSFVKLNIKGGYDNLLSEKINTILERKKQLKHRTEIGLISLKYYQNLVDEGIIPIETAQAKFLSWFRSINAETGVFWFIFDKTAEIIAHTNPSMEGVSISSLKDMKGRYIARIAPDGSFTTIDGEFNVFRWKVSAESSNEEKYVGYFTSFSLWQWTIGTVIGVDDIEAEVKIKRDNIIEVLGNTFAKINIAKTGYIFLFNSKKEMIIPPPDAKKKLLNKSTNILTGNLILDDLIKIASSNENSINYISSYEATHVMYSQVSYFKPLDWYIVVNVPIYEIQLPAKNLVTRLSLIIGLIFLVSLIIVYILVYNISKPLDILTDYVKELPLKDFTSNKEEYSPIYNLPAKYKDEVGRLAVSFIFMEKELKKYIIDLMETTAAKQRIEGELNVARGIQMGILPKLFPPPFSNFPEIELFAMLEPAKEVGGDLYDFFLIDNDHLCFALGDVSDKGVPAALFMVITRTLIKMSANKDISPAEMMTKINDTLSVDNPNSMFVTLVICILNLNTGELSYSNGGHNPPIIIKNNGDVYYKREISGPIVGAMEDIPFVNLSLQLEQGDSIFLYTDGVTEAMNIDHVQFSDGRLLKEVELLRDEATENFIKQINFLVREHAGKAPQSDDITMLMLRYNGRKTSNNQN